MNKQQSIQEQFQVGGKHHEFALHMINKYFKMWGARGVAEEILEFFDRMGEGKTPEGYQYSVSAVSKTIKQLAAR